IRTEARSLDRLEELLRNDRVRVDVFAIERRHDAGMYSEFIHDALACSKPEGAFYACMTIRVTHAVRRIKNRLLCRLVADRPAQMLQVFAKAVHRVASGEAEQKPGERRECESAQKCDAIDVHVGLIPACECRRNALRWRQPQPLPG